MCADAGTDSFDTVWRKKPASLLRRLRDSSNIILQVIACRVDSSLIWSFANQTRSVLVINQHEQKTKLKYFSPEKILDETAAVLIEFVEFKSVLN